MITLTREQAIQIAESGIWKTWTAEQVVKFQLYQTRLCMSFSHFHKCVEEVLGRPVFTHEFASADNLKAELEGKKSKPTLDEILGLLDNKKLVVVVT